MTERGAQRCAHAKIEMERRTPKAEREAAGRWLNVKGEQAPDSRFS